ncbi:MAG: glycosyltransferase family protein [Planctomycetota bacterium]
MATIFYSVMGEGRGHAARARSMVEALRGRHRVVLYTSHDALRFLGEQYDGDPEVEVREIPGLRFHYTGGELDNGKTIREGLSFWLGRGREVQRLLADFDRERPDLVVCDFEPLLPRAAHRRGVPVLSLDHQHFMVAYDLSSLPKRLQRWAWAMGWSIWMFGIGQQRSVISAFYDPPLRPAWRDAVQVGPLLRPAVRDRKPVVGGHVLTYLRPATPPRVVEMLSRLATPVRIYGLGVRAPVGSATFHAINERAFLDDLSACDCVIAAAGNQLLGEALYFGKPVFALPEWNHHEQCINAHFLKQLGGGDWAPLERVGDNDLRVFLSRREGYRRALAESGLEFDGTPAAAAAIEAMLEPSSKAQHAGHAVSA